MRHNLNTLPKGMALPAEFKGKEPIHLVQGTIADDSDEVLYRALCKDGSYVGIPESSLVKAK